MLIACVATVLWLYGRAIFGNSKYSSDNAIVLALLKDRIFGFKAIPAAVTRSHSVASLLAASQSDFKNSRCALFVALAAIDMPEADAHVIAASYQTSSILNRRLIAACINAKERRLSTNQLHEVLEVCKSPPNDGNGISAQLAVTCLKFVEDQQLVVVALDEVLKAVADQQSFGQRDVERDAVAAMKGRSSEREFLSHLMLSGNYLSSEEALTRLFSIDKRQATEVALRRLQYHLPTDGQLADTLNSLAGRHISSE
jgi:hypothetical protein